MATTNWGDAGVVDLLGLEPTMLQALINASNEAGQRMTALGAQVDGAAASIRPAMVSNAGQILQQRLAIWHQDFARIISAFVGPNSLTDRSEQMLRALIAANVSAADAASSGQG